MIAIIAIFEKPAVRTVLAPLKKGRIVALLNIDTLVAELGSHGPETVQTVFVVKTPINVTTILIVIGVINQIAIFVPARVAHVLRILIKQVM